MLLLPTNHLLAQTALSGGERSGNSKTHIIHFGISGVVDTVECLARSPNPVPETPVLTEEMAIQAGAGVSGFANLRERNTFTPSRITE